MTFTRSSTPSKHGKVVNPVARETPRVALVGISGYGRFYLNLLESLWDEGYLDLDACVVVNPGETEEDISRLRQKGCRVYGDYTVMLNDLSGKLDHCFLPTPIFCHTPMTIDCLRAGAHVLVEKPLAASIRECEAMAAAEATSRGQVAVGFQDLFLPQIADLKKMLVEGTLGRLLEIKTLCLWPRDTGYYGRNNWAGKIQIDGKACFDSPLNNACSHFLNLALFLAGGTRETSAHPTGVEGDLFRAQAIENFDSLALRFQTDAEVPVFTYFSHSCRETVGPQLEVTTSAGKILWFHHDRMEIHMDGQPVNRIPLPSPQETRLTVIRNFLAWTRGANVPVCEITHAREHVNAVQLAQSSCPIHSMDPKDLEMKVGRQPGHKQTCIKGLEETFLRLFKESALLDKATSPWVG